jgi:hypothetical protein
MEEPNYASNFWDSRLAVVQKIIIMRALRTVVV